MLTKLSDITQTETVEYIHRLLCIQTSAIGAPNESVAINI